MSTGPRFRVPFRRRREKRTDYRYRRALIKSGLPRAVVRISNRHVRIQIANYDPAGDIIIASAFSGELRSAGWAGNCDNTPGAYLTGMLAGKRCLSAGIEEVIMDIGMHVSTKGSTIYAAMKGIIDAGVKVPHSDEVVPSDERIVGANLSNEVQEHFSTIKDKLQKEGEGAINNG